jgi:hypothetical protein
MVEQLLLIQGGEKAPSLCTPVIDVLSYGLGSASNDDPDKLLRARVDLFKRKGWKCEQQREYTERGETLLPTS